MPDETDPGRTYSDREVRLILKSAAELQQRTETDASGGMSLAQLEQVAVEAGLDPALVRRAAAALDTVGPPSEHNAFLGSASYVVLERVVDVAIDPGEFDQLLNVVRAVTREVGEVSTIGRQFGWKGRLDGAKAEVTISADERRTSLRVRVELDEVALGHFMMKGMLFGAGGGLVATGMLAAMLGPAAVVGGAAMLATGYVWSRSGFRRGAMRFRGRARELLDALAERTFAIGKASEQRSHSERAVR